MGGYTEFEVHLMTGRSHQIRAHLASIGHPIIGDYKYGDSGVNVYFKKNARITVTCFFMQAALYLRTAGDYGSMWC